MVISGGWILGKGGGKRWWGNLRERSCEIGKGISVGPGVGVAGEGKEGKMGRKGYWWCCEGERAEPDNTKKGWLE